MFVTLLLSVADTLEQLHQRCDGFICRRWKGQWRQTLPSVTSSTKAASRLHVCFRSCCLGRKRDKRVSSGTECTDVMQSSNRLHFNRRCRLKQFPCETIVHYVPNLDDHVSCHCLMETPRRQLAWKGAARANSVIYRFSTAVLATYTRRLTLHQPCAQCDVVTECYINHEHKVISSLKITLWIKSFFFLIRH